MKSNNLILTLISVLLLASSLISPYGSLTAAFFFTLFLPGYLIVYAYFNYLKMAEKLLLAVLLSVMVSTHLIYALSLLIGYSKQTILISFLLLSIPLFVPFHHTASKHQPGELKGVCLCAGIAFVAFVVLSRTVWVWHSNHLILSGSNWQDTPMHYEIIESINNGNFPPEMPYYAGVRMLYHYFVDFHTAILEKSAGVFLPHLVVVTNTIFIFIFALALFALASYIKNERAGAFAALLGTLGAGFSFVGAFHAILLGNFSIVTNYAFEYGKFFTIPPIFDNLLQQRPQLIGLPALTTAAYLLYRGSKSLNRREIALAGLITGLMFPFHILACVSTLLIFLLISLKNRHIGAPFIIFAIPPILPYAIPLLRASAAISHNTGILKAPWIYYFLEGNPVLFYVANLGLPFIMALLYLGRDRNYFLYSWMLSLLALPNLLSFTPNPWDMYKFFHYAWIPVAISAGCLLADISVMKRVAYLVPVLLIISMLSSFMVIAWNLSTNYPAADIHEYKVGLWVRNNTPPKSVFLTWPSIHAPVSMIGGRLRVLGFVNWAYGHGFDFWVRYRDIERAYGGNISDTLTVMCKYNASYLYVGRDELKHTRLKKFESCPQLEPVYSDRSGIYIFALRNVSSPYR